MSVCLASHQDMSCFEYCQPGTPGDEHTLGDMEKSPNATQPLDIPSKGEVYSGTASDTSENVMSTIIHHILSNHAVAKDSGWGPPIRSA